MDYTNELIKTLIECPKKITKAPAKHFKFNGTARAAEQGNLNELLHHLGPETTPGVYQISL